MRSDVAAGPRNPREVRPKKRFGQHFLKDPNTARIVADGTSPDDVVLEVGPGRGFLTGFLLERARHVHAVEIDADVLPYLKEATAGAENLDVHEADALLFDYARLDPPPDRLVANLPYNVASPLVLRLLEEVPTLGTLRFMVQLEVARRMTAKRRTKDYGAYAVLIQHHAAGRIVHRVPRTVFDPPPRVDSAVVELSRREPDLAPRSYPAFKQLVLRAFATRRKRLLNGFPKEERPAYRAALGAVGFGEDTRAEELSPESFVALFRALERGGAG